MTEVIHHVLTNTGTVKNVNKNNVSCCAHARAACPPLPAPSSRALCVHPRCHDATHPFPVRPCWKVTHAVLFEAINLVIHLGHTTELLPQACGLLGRFISIREANIRYLGLEAMARLTIAQPDQMEALKKHSQTIFFSLKDQDISIRRRALDLVYSMCAPAPAPAPAAFSGGACCLPKQVVLPTRTSGALALPDPPRPWCLVAGGLRAYLATPAASPRAQPRTQPWARCVGAQLPPSPATSPALSSP